MDELHKIVYILVMCLSTNGERAYSNTEATENKVQFFKFSIQGKGISVP